MVVDTIVVALQSTNDSTGFSITRRLEHHGCEFVYVSYFHPYTFHDYVYNSWSRIISRYLVQLRDCQGHI